MIGIQRLSLWGWLVAYTTVADQNSIIILSIS